ncbi:FecR domain-containing protein [Sphingomonas sp. BIUV-7]|uniref:FecR domain-containing protein n=2 Tax=Sphingomonas natans TaxID=3063330 RepID=A0ABT8YDS8_9SPHN|nr:FecR domain-containing protein [Sphingomonas sp. BIUV-7]MDO6416097.1 FecR domain-containing protein [Sphingomonas sp. BIUV-7]
MRGPDAARWSAELDAWRAADPAHDAAYARLLQRWDQSVFLTHSALAGKRDLRRAAIWWRRPAIGYAALAAVLLLVAGLGILTLGRVGHATPAAPTLYASAGARPRSLAFADGARVILDAASAISVRDDAGGREIRLIQGRVRVDATPASKAPLFVAANAAFAVSDGGLFDVSITGPVVRVVSWRGTVRVATERGGKPAGLQYPLLAAGYEIALEGAGTHPRAVPTNPDNFGWPRGMLTFDRVRLADAIAAINRYNLVQISLADTVSGNLRVTGAFHAAEPDAFASAVAKMFDLTVGKSPDGSILLSPAIKT